MLGAQFKAGFVNSLLSQYHGLSLVSRNQNGFFMDSVAWRRASWEGKDIAAECR